MGLGEVVSGEERGQGLSMLTVGPSHGLGEGRAHARAMELNMCSCSRTWQGSNSGSGSCDWHLLPREILISILILLRETRTRNIAALVCKRWQECERESRFSLVVRGSLLDLISMPPAFTAVKSLDLSKCTPWGHHLLSGAPFPLLQRFFSFNFPQATDITCYVRDEHDISCVAKSWPHATKVKLERWHSNTQSSSVLRWGSRREGDVTQGLHDELSSLLSSCQRLEALDLTHFFCFPEDVAAALSSPRLIPPHLRTIHLSHLPACGGLRASQLKAIANSCPQLDDIRCLCEFDPRYEDCINDDALLCLAASCPELKTVHLTDSSEMMFSSSHLRFLPSLDARITTAGFRALLASAPNLRELRLFMSHNLKFCPESPGQPFSSEYAVAHSPGEQLVGATHLPALRSLQLGRAFSSLDMTSGKTSDQCLQTVDNEDRGSCLPHPLGGLILHKLEEFSVRHIRMGSHRVVMPLAGFATSLSSLSFYCCQDLTPTHLSMLASSLASSLKKISVLNCPKVSSHALLSSLIPLAATLEELEMKCDWRTDDRQDGTDHQMSSGDGAGAAVVLQPAGSYGRQVPCKRRRGGFGLSQNPTSPLPTGQSLPGQGPTDSKMPSSAPLSVQEFPPWQKLQSLKLWSLLGTLLDGLPVAGLHSCPVLERVVVRVEGNGRYWNSTSAPAFGISCLRRYPALNSVVLDLQALSGFSLSCPPGFVEVAVWERFYLHGIQSLSCSEIEYFPPSSCDSKRRAITLGPAGIFSSCPCLRKLVLHGTVGAHVLSLILRCQTLRDVQVKGDFYPIHDDMSSEMRLNSFKKFEQALRSRVVAD